MKIYHTAEISDPSKKVVTLGNFDGVHAGHLELLRTTVDLADKRKMTSCVLTFFPHPRIFFGKDLQFIQSMEDKEKAVRETGIAMMVHLPFTKELAQCSAQDFVETILCEQLQTAVLVVGYNFRFGKDREGTVESLAEIAASCNIETIIVPPVYIDQQPVSSSLIRKYYQKGDMEAVKRSTGNYPVIKGRVIEGKKLGRTIGFPTANVASPLNLLLPGKGVYAVKCIVENKSYQGVANIGTNPTVNSDSKLHLEVHMFDFNQDIYQHMITITFIHKIRNEQRFSDLSQLQRAIENDVTEAKKILQQDT